MFKRKIKKRVNILKDNKRRLIYVLISVTTILFLAVLGWNFYERGMTTGKSEGGKKKQTTTILVMGLHDEKALEREHLQGDNGYLDSMALIVLDRTSNRISMIPVSTDTVCPVEVYYTDGTKAKKKQDMQISYQFAYGSDAQSGVELTVSAVENLMNKKITVDNYVLLPTESVEKMISDYQENIKKDAWTSWDSGNVLWDTVGSKSVIISNIEDIDIFRYRVRSLLVSNKNMKAYELEGETYEHTGFNEFYPDEESLEEMIAKVWYH